MYADTRSESDLKPLEQNHRSNLNDALTLFDYSLKMGRKAFTDKFRERLEKQIKDVYNELVKHLTLNRESFNDHVILLAM